MLLGSALMVASAVISQGGPGPDLMNSIWRMRLEAQKSANGDGVSSESFRGGAKDWSCSP